MSVVNNGNLVTKVYFPREILPLSTAGAAFFDLLMSALVFVILMIIYKTPLSLNLLYLLIIIPSFVLITTGISFIFSAINVLFRDVRFVVPLLLQIWFFLTPVIYSASQVPQKYQIIFKVNPLVSLIENFRTVTIYAKSPNVGDILLYFFVSAFIFIAGYWFFKHNEKIFADVM